jgi:FkbM family methyltransferase
MQETRKQETWKSVLVKTYPAWSLLLPNFYYPYKLEGGRIYLNIKESGMMLRRALRCYELAKHEALRKFLRPGATFIDVGCNKGDFSLLASRLVGPEGRVLSFEPHPENCRWFRKSVARNDYRNIELFELALSDANGTAQLHIGEKSGFHTLLAGKPQREKGIIEVRTRRLDDLLAEIRFDRRVDAIKIDVEGADMHVLRGARKTIAANPNIVVFLDVHPHLGVDPKEVRDYFTGLGLSLFAEEPPFNVAIQNYDGLDALVAMQAPRSSELPLDASAAVSARS